MDIATLRVELAGKKTVQEKLDYIATKRPSSSEEAEKWIAHLLKDIFPQLEKTLFASAISLRLEEAVGAGTEGQASSPGAEKTSAQVMSILSSCFEPLDGVKNKFRQLEAVISSVARTQDSQTIAIVKGEKEKHATQFWGEVILFIYRQLLPQDWPHQLMIENQNSAGLATDEVLSVIFNLRDRIVGVLEGCPRCLVDSVYFRDTVFAALFLEANFFKYKEPQQILTKVALLNLAKYIPENALQSQAVLEAISRSNFKWKYLTTFLKEGLDYDHRSLKIDDGEAGEIDEESLAKLHKNVFQFKNPSCTLAERVLLKVIRPATVELRERILELLMALWGSQRSFMQVASVQQQYYVTYLAYETAEACDSSVYFREEISAHLQKGVSHRIGSGEVPKSIQDMGLLLWKQYANKNGLEQLAKEEDEDSEYYSFTSITKESVFASFFAVNKEAEIMEDLNGQNEAQPGSRAVAKEVAGTSSFTGKEAESQDDLKQVSSQEEKEKTKNEFYTQDDSDNESDFEVKYANDEDDFADVEKKVKSQRPLFIQDLILGIRSDDFERYHLAVESVEQVVSANPNDLDLMCPELMQVLFRAQNKFEVDDFDEKKWRAITSVVLAQPRIACSEIVSRILDTEASLGEKVLLSECLKEAAVELSNAEKPADAGSDKQALLQKADNEFFGIKQLSDSPLETLGKVKRVSASLLKTRSKQQGKKNLFHAHASQLVYAVIYLLEEPLILEQQFLGGRLLFTLSTLLQLSANHWEVGKFTERTFDLFTMLVNFVPSQSLFTKTEGYSPEKLANVQTQFKMGLALVVSQNTKWLNPTQKREAEAWLDDQIELYGGDETLEQVKNASSEDHQNLKNICLYARSALAKE